MFVVQELEGYSDAEVRNIFVRLNKFVVKLSPQELRHALGHGKFHDFVERLGKLGFWREQRVFSPLQLRRMRAVEFSAELTVLLIEGPQDKKSAINLYYNSYEKGFPDKSLVEERLQGYLKWILKAIPDLSRRRFRKPIDLYSLIGALDKLSDQGRRLSQISPGPAGSALAAFETQIETREPIGDAARYALAASRQTDNITPRITRIEILATIVVKRA